MSMKKAWLLSGAAAVLATTGALAVFSTLRAAPPPQPTAAKLAGIYQLVGVMETAAGLELRPNGRYQWAISVGGLDAEVQGNWIYQPVDAAPMLIEEGDAGFVILTADGGAERIAKAIRLQRVVPIAELLPQLPAKHLLRAHPDAAVLRLIDGDGSDVAANFAEAYIAPEHFVELTLSKDEGNDRWLGAELPAGKSLAGARVFATPEIYRDLQLDLKPGQVAEIVIDREALTGEPWQQMQVLWVMADGSLKSAGWDTLNPKARYVRR